ncbi:MAG: hypothetical protein VYA34_07375 [Myxococcota bacterium]|nr:hypothetical protein [Myxococcota bacterium]
MMNKQTHLIDSEIIDASIIDENQLAFEFLRARQRSAIDSMNLVELPFSLLTDGRHDARKQNHPDRDYAVPTSIYLNEDGHERLVAGEGERLPSALAERVVLGLLWLSNEHGLPQELEFSLRHLVEKYMYPHRKSKANARSLSRVVEELHSIATTRIVSNRWYDKEYGQQTEMNASIIDYVQFIDGPRGKIVKLKWGSQVYKSVVDKYTKSLNVRFLMTIDRALDLRFYRWLDRQLATKKQQVVQSSQKFAKYKMLMSSKKLSAGGKTASSYVTSQLEDSLKRLQDRGLCVRMTVDKSFNDYRLVFERLPKAERRVEIVEEDKATELVKHFWTFLTDDLDGIRVSKKEHHLAGEWLTRHGPERPFEMIPIAVEHATKHKTKAQITSFCYLAAFESAARAEINQRKKKPKKISRQEAEDAYALYHEQRLTEAKETLSGFEYEKLSKEAAERARLSPEFTSNRKKVIQEAIVRSVVEEALIQRMGGESEEAFIAILMGETD